MIDKKSFVGFISTTFVFCFFITCSTDNDDNLNKKANSDNLIQTREVQTYENSKKFVISKIQPNKFDVRGKEFLVKPNSAGDGCFIYDPRTNFNGVERNLIWWAPSENKAYPLNSPSKMITPGLNWAREDGIDSPMTTDVIDYIFKGKPLPEPKSQFPKTGNINNTFTVKEYNIYKEVVNAPMSISEDKALSNAAKKYGLNVEETEKAVNKVQQILFKNHWFGAPDSEIRHASDWVEKK